MLELGLHENADAPVSIAEVSRATSISKTYLEQLAMVLRHASLLRARSGRQGGFMLTRSAREITVRQIVEASTGPLSLTDCVGDANLCARSDYCACRPVWVAASDAVGNVLESYSLADLAANEREARARVSSTGPPLVEDIRPRRC
jgi:Rrf2 family protein